jgi:hypothetical protein
MIAGLFIHIGASFSAPATVASGQKDTTPT